MCGASKWVQRHLYIRSHDASNFHVPLLNAGRPNLRYSHLAVARSDATLVEKSPSIRPFSPQLFQPAANSYISPGSIENMDQGALVPVLICLIVPVIRV
jgi:hypothetical protein